MSTTQTNRMLRLFTQKAEPTKFFTERFQSPEVNFYDTEKVVIDIERLRNDIAIPVQDLSVISRGNTLDVSTSKEYEAPIYSEHFKLNSIRMLKRSPGSTPFESPEGRMSIIRDFQKNSIALRDKIMRAVEFQSSQVLQEGIVTLVNKTNGVVYTIDYKPKASHLITVGTAWQLGGATIIDDMRNAAQEVQNNSFLDVNMTIMGGDAFDTFLANPAIQTHFDNRRINMGLIQRVEGPANSEFQGTISLGSFKLDIFTYNKTFTDPVTNLETPYMTPNYVIIMGGAARFDATWGSIPLIGDARTSGVMSLFPQIPSRLSSSELRSDIFHHMWIEPDGRTLMGSVSARPLMIPTQIDGFARIDTLIT